MRKLDLQSKEDSKLIATIKLKTSGFNSGAVLTEIFISKNGIIYVNAITKSEKKTSSHLFILVEGKDKVLEVSSSIMEKTFIPVADSELIGLLKTSFENEDAYQVLTDVEAKPCFGDKAKQIKDKNNNLLFVPFVYKTSGFDVLLDLNTGKVVGLIDYITKGNIEIRPDMAFGLADYESQFIELADQISNINEGNKREKQADLLGRVLRRRPPNKEEVTGEQI